MDLGFIDLSMVIFFFNGDFYVYMMEGAQSTL